MARRFNQLDGKTWLKYSISVWELPRIAEDRNEHPAPFPVALAERVIQIYTNPGDLVIDPMCGSGTTLAVANRLGRHAHGVELNPDYGLMALDRITQTEAQDVDVTISIGDARNLTDYVEPGSARLCLFSPPYWDVLNRKRTVTGGAITPYSDHPDDLGNAETYGKYLLMMNQIMAQVYRALQPDGHCVLVCMDIRRGSRFYPLHQDLTNVAQAVGFDLEDIIIWDRRKDYYTFRPIGYPHRFRVNKAHEYLLIFRKPPEEGAHRGEVGNPADGS